MVLPDPVKGEIACAYVVRREGAEVTEAELIDFSRHQLAAYKRPRRVVFTDTLPATSSGKIMRRKLAEASGLTGYSHHHHAERVASSSCNARSARTRSECLDRSRPVSERICSSR